MMTTTAAPATETIDGDDTTGAQSATTRKRTTKGARETAGTTRGEATTADGTATSKGAGDTRGSTRGDGGDQHRHRRRHHHGGQPRTT